MTPLIVFDDGLGELAPLNDLRAAFEAASNVPLGPFFDRWILGSDLPAIRVNTVVATDRLSAVVQIEQLGEPFSLPVALDVQYADGQAESVLVPVTDAKTSYLVTRDRPIRRIAVDDSLTLGDVR